MILVKAIRRLCREFSNAYSKFATYLILKGEGAKFSSFETKGTPHISVARRGGKLQLGKNFRMNNNCQSNPAGGNGRCILFVDENATLKIGDNVGISQTALIASDDISIGNYVKIGGGTFVYTSDFHSLDPAIRRSSEDMASRKHAPVIIKDNAFIGAHCIILKGVTIGENVIVGAGSVVTKSIPDNEIWAGNPAKFIKNL